ncbi:MAG: molybdopterin-synthase adenylyltransferase MoeB [Armatimonadota bacterium]|nr:molybdopterin-synthase adenylyltransferase MoeB [Armatimonadota bacterium]MDR7403848.1 molybdopterin-synthase adenylyltransferase MoeB [Armatimonadota bacterium]MDR7613006.1 molybdopterin-synthase adenylyltransferase MoeB [Armatimonadota bacterium]
MTLVTRPGPLLTAEQMERYSRQTILEEVGLAGQRRLLDSKVLIVGAGGLGSPAALYLAAAGVGTLGIVDGDRVDLSNLHRQILHFTHDIGRPKTQSARRTLEDINPDVTVIPHQTVLSSENALDIIADYEVVVNGSDNFPTRYLVNDACVFLGKPLVDASILRWEGHATVFVPGRGCYRCLFPTPPPPGTVPSCAEGGIIGAVAGFMGTLQALETIKILLGRGETLVNRLLIVDALAAEIRTVRWSRNPDCPVCGDRPTITQLIDYEAFCGVPRPHPQPQPTAARTIPEVGPAEARALVERGEAVLLDVREEWEWVTARIPGALFIPMAEVPRRLEEIPRDRTTIVFCATGQRSATVTETLRAAGYDRAVNLAGGIVAWMNEQYPVEAGPTWSSERQGDGAGRGKTT